ncbi:MAG: UbiA family prenyltransferase [Balneolaceae bacterium]|nr:UbiA family prenyltransferase [Balneolaceae bacterium]
MNEKKPLTIQIWHFLLHLRWHYQLFILSGGYLLGGYFTSEMDWQMFLVQFLNVHLLLFGGATAYNSYWDRDEGPIGGLKNPPKMSDWMWFASLFLQAVGLIIAIPAGNLFIAVYGVSMLFFWLYSSPMARWKGKPIRSLLAIGISTGTNSMLLGFLAAGGQTIGLTEGLAALGVALVILSLYPTSQIYQMEEDRRRGDRTFAVEFGAEGVLKFYSIAFGLGILLLSITILSTSYWLGGFFFITGLISGRWVWNQLTQLSSEWEDYRRVMNIKYGTSLAFVAFLTLSILLRHTDFGIFLGINLF